MFARHVWSNGSNVYMFALYGKAINKFTFNEVVECRISNKLAQSPATTKIVNVSQNL